VNPGPTVDLPGVLCYDFCRSEKEPDVWECLGLNIERRNKPAGKHRKKHKYVWPKNLVRIHCKIEGLCI